MRSMGRWTALACLLGAGFSAFGAVIHRDVSELTVEAQRIVVGDVVEVTSFWDERHELIKSRVVVAAETYLAGAGTGTEVLELSGGTVDDVTLHVSVLPEFQAGDHVLLFLRDNPTRLVQSFQGAFLTDGVQATTMAPGCRRVVEDAVIPLAELHAAIARALPAGTVVPPIKPYTGHFVLPTGGLRYSTCGYSWAYQAVPMGENYVINANCADASAGDATSQRTQIQNAVAAWNASGADFLFTYGGASALSDVVYDGTNLIYFDTTPPGSGYVAATYIWQSGGNILECDLVFNDLDYIWWNGSGACGGNKMDIWNVATHELGHFLCLADLYNSADSAKTMYGYVSNCDVHARDLDPDDINGIRGIYGACAAPLANAGPGKALCTGNSVQLQGSASGGSGGLCPGNYSPSWAGPGVVSGGNTLTPTVNVPSTYTLTVSCAGCVSTDQVVVGTAAPGDWDGNGQINLADFAQFRLCLSGPGGGYVNAGCACGDVDVDGDVDFDDFAAFQDAYTG